MAYRPRPRRASVDPSNPRMWATDDRSGFVVNQQDMVWQNAWAGVQIINTQLLVHRDFEDELQEQLRTIIIPPDPPPVYNARPEQYTIDETDYLVLNDDSSFVLLVGGGKTILQPSSP